MIIEVFYKRSKFSRIFWLSTSKLSFDTLEDEFLSFFKNCAKIVLLHFDISVNISSKVCPYPNCDFKIYLCVIEVHLNCLH